MLLHFAPNSTVLVSLPPTMGRMYGLSTLTRRLDTFLPSNNRSCCCLIVSIADKRLQKSGVKFNCFSCALSKEFVCPKSLPKRSFNRRVAYKSYKEYLIPLRRVVFFDEEQGRGFTFLTYNFIFPALALVIAELYRNRWQTELFFKWLKQHLEVKRGLKHKCKYRNNTNLLCNNYLLSYLDC